MSCKMTRRHFTQAGAAALGLAASRVPAAPKKPAGDPVRLGIIGTGNRGRQLMSAFLQQNDAEIVALCDVDETQLDQAKKMVSSGVVIYKDFRKMLENKDLDAVVIATPEHWHAVMVIQACEAGKDVYVEKPLTIVIAEGRKMVEAVRRTNRIVQVGLQSRSSEAFQKLAALVQQDGIGKVTVARAYHVSNMWPNGIGKEPDSPPPPTLDWDMWLGPRAMRPYRKTIVPYKFRWWHLYSSQIANNGVHWLDAILWVLGEKAPASVCAMGGKFAVDDDRTIPDTMEAVFEMASGRLIIFGHYEANGNPVLPQPGIEFRGTRGTAYAQREGFEIVPEKGGQFQDPAPRMEPVSFSTGVRDSTADHVANFLECVKTRRKPNCDIEDGHRATTMALLANISLAVRARLEWDAEREVILNHKEANEMLRYEYRAPWSLGG
ncbi:MAG: Gfo/Idh/MocA family oxidoreductase [Candidatus Sumerlaeia bacterium]|nr:Gfo/Idh/MocA family oxidoreductase [Candidatus Sumerlaeia bacterium]